MTVHRKFKTMYRVLQTPDYDCLQKFYFIRIVERIAPLCGGLLSLQMEHNLIGRKVL